MRNGCVPRRSRESGRASSAQQLSRGAQRQADEAMKSCCEPKNQRSGRWWLLGGAFALALGAIALNSWSSTATAVQGGPGRMPDSPPSAPELEAAYSAVGSPVSGDAANVSGDAAKASKIRRYSLEAAPSDVALVAGRDKTRVWAYNGQVPGPVLRVRQGETLRVDLTNHLPQPTTIHWHGVRVPNAMDGVPGVTQPAVPPGGSFRYEFTPKDVGTFWFHPHVRGSEQVERGLYGVLVVEDAEPPPWSQDVVWVLDDWRLTRDAQVSPRFNTHHDLMHDGRWGNVVSVNGKLDTVLRVRPGERIRLRLVNTANARIFEPDFSALNATAIAVDGMYASKPFSPAGFELAPGNRLDLDLTFPNAQAGQRFEIRDRFSRRGFEIASIEVGEESPVTTPKFATLANAHLPDWGQLRERAPDLEYVLGAKRGGKYGIAWTLNGDAYGEDTPAQLPSGRLLKLRYDNQSARLHPMHMHGVFFRVLARDGKPVDEPHFRDTVLVHPRETVDIGLVPIDGGRWALHCHILEHAEAGMMTTFKVAPMK